jgi:hypothetical protein
MQTSSNAACVLVLCLLCAAVPGSSGAPDRVLFDFESGTYDGWTVEGDAFGRAPFPTAEALAWRPDRRPHGMQGRYFVKSGGERHLANPDGRLVSDAFTIDRPYLTFLLGGELHPRVRVSLEVGGGAVRVAYGNNSYDLRLRGWDVRDLHGRTGRVVIEDPPGRAHRQHEPVTLPLSPALSQPRPVRLGDTCGRTQSAERPLPGRRRDHRPRPGWHRVHHAQRTVGWGGVDRAAALALTHASRTMRTRRLTRCARARCRRARSSARSNSRRRRA